MEIINLLDGQIYNELMNEDSDKRLCLIIYKRFGRNPIFSNKNCNNKIKVVQLFSSYVS